MIRLTDSMVAGEELVTTVTALMDSRQTILPKWLMGPGPDASQLERIYKAAATAPDHGQIHPWRLISIPQSARFYLAEAFALALFERDSHASEHEMSRAREKAYRAPLLILMVVDSKCDDPVIDLSERLISAGCALQNMLLMATALGFGSALTSGKALKSAGLRALFRLSTHELALCFVSIGTVQSTKKAACRPQISNFVSELSI
jgi:nitroreductase